VLALDTIRRAQFVPLHDWIIQPLTFIVRISPTRDSIPGWTIGGEGSDPQIVSELLVSLP
jgi:hypothetical protein